MRSVKLIDATQISSTPGLDGQVIYFRDALPRSSWTAHLRAAVCYVSLNPVRAGLVARAEDWPWSSVRAHLAGRVDTLASVRPVLERVPDLGELLKNDCDEIFAVLRRAERNGRPAGAEEFVTGLERLLGRPIARHAPGRKPTPAVTEKLLNLLQ